MSSLQTGLVILGGLVLAFVVGYNAWTLHRSSPKRAPKDAKLASVQRSQEPVLLSSDVEAETPKDSMAIGSTHAGQADELTLPQEPVLKVLQVPLAAARDWGHQIDPLIDAIFPISLEQPVSGDAVLAALPSTRHIGTKPFMVEGHAVDEEGFERIQAGRRYDSLQAALQLANRSGALNEIEFSEFVTRLRAIVDGLGGELDIPEMLHEIARARELDQFASLHDAQLGFVLKPKHSVLSVGFVQHHAQELGFVPGTLPGRLVLPSPDGFAGPILTLKLDTQAALAEEGEAAPVSEIRLMLDVNWVDSSLRPFARMRETAQALSRSMGVTVTDESGQTLTEDMLNQIDEALVSLYEVLADHDLAAGSAQARRLFS